MLRLKFSPIFSQDLRLSPVPWKPRGSWNSFPPTCTSRGWEYKDKLVMVGICVHRLILLTWNFSSVSSLMTLFLLSHQIGHMTLWPSELLLLIIKASKAVASENCCTNWKKPGNSEWIRTMLTKALCCKISCSLINNGSFPRLLPLIIHQNLWGGEVKQGEVI